MIIMKQLLIMHCSRLRGTSTTLHCITIHGTLTTCVHNATEITFTHSKIHYVRIMKYLYGKLPEILTLSDCLCVHLLEEINDESEFTFTLQ